MKLLKNVSLVVMIGFVLLIVTGSNKVEKVEINKKINRKEVTSNYIVQNNELIIVKEPMTEADTVKYFNTVEKEINEYVSSNDFENVKDKLNDLFISTVDFVFYGKEINGVTFNDLTEETKTQILNILERIDNTIENQKPGYKIVLKNKSSELYTNISEKVKEGISYTDNFLEEKIGVEKYQDIKEVTTEFGSDVKEITVDAFNGSKELVKEGFGIVKNWYENKREK